MHSGKSYRLSEFLVWTRQNIFWLFIPGVAPTLVYQVAGIKWIAIPWTVVALLGTATAFIVGFKNTQTYNCTWDARQIWGAIFINGDKEMGSFCSYKRFDAIDLRTSLRTNLMDLFYSL